MRRNQSQILDLIRMAAPIATTWLIAQTSRPNSTSPSAAKPQRRINTRNICTCLSLNKTENERKSDLGALRMGFVREGQDLASPYDVVYCSMKLLVLAFPALLIFDRDEHRHWVLGSWIFNPLIKAKELSQTNLVKRTSLNAPISA